MLGLARVGVDDLSAETTSKTAVRDETDDESATGAKWIRSLDLKGKLEQLVS